MKEYKTGRRLSSSSSSQTFHHSQHHHARGSELEAAPDQDRHGETHDEGVQDVSEGGEGAAREGRKDEGGGQRRRVRYEATARGAERHPRGSPGHVEQAGEVPRRADHLLG